MLAPGCSCCPPCSLLKLLYGPQGGQLCACCLLLEHDAALRRTCWTVPFTACTHTENTWDGRAAETWIVTYVTLRTEVSANVQQRAWGCADLHTLTEPVLLVLLQRRSRLFLCLPLLLRKLHCRGLLSCSRPLVDGVAHELAAAGGNTTAGQQALCTCRIRYKLPGSLATERV